MSNTEAYTAIILWPDYLADDYGEDYILCHVKAPNGTAAIRKAMASTARKLDRIGYGLKDLYDLKCIALFHGHCKPVTEL